MSLIRLGIVFLVLAILWAGSDNLIKILICKPLVTKDVEHHFMCLLVIHICFMKCLQVFCSFLKNQVVFNKDLLYSTCNSDQCLWQPGWEGVWGRMDTCICIAESLSCSPETIRTLFANQRQFSSVAQSCPTLCCPMDCSTPGLPVHHQLQVFTQTYVHWVGDAIQPSHLLSPFPPAFSLPQNQGLFKWVRSSHLVAKLLEF